MSDQANQAITALRIGHNELADLVRGMSLEDLTRPSGAARWDVSRVLSHLGSGAEIALATVGAALEGAGNPGLEFNRMVWARWDALLAPTERAAGFLRANEAMVQRFETLDDTTRGELRIDLRFLPEPVDVATAAGLRLSEFTYHAWDVTVAFDPAGVLAPAAANLLVDPLGMIIGFLGHAEALEGRQVSLAVRTTAPERCFGLEVRHAVTLIEEPQQPDGVLNAPGEAWLRLAAGRLAPAHTPPTVQLTSEVITLDDLRRVFPGF
ncbi:MAG: maleylpyruvate isomerase family mycothiol-dependent enzyme [Pseudonocardiales bacterium]|nr:maleylpyruvate isomerase family mycothiol-dependent enzyme [Pseudonocardiales bacterium]